MNMSSNKTIPEYRRRLNTQGHGRPGTNLGSSSSKPGEVATNLNITVRSGESLGSCNISAFYEFLSNNGKTMHMVLGWLLMTNINVIFEFPIEWFYFLAFTFRVTSKAYKSSMRTFILLSAGIFIMDYVILTWLSFKTTAIIATTLIQIILISGSLNDFGLLSPSIEATMGVIVALFFIALRFAIWDVSPINDMYFPPDSVQDKPEAQSSQPQWPAPFTHESRLVSLHNILPPLAVHCTSFAIVYTFWTLATALKSNFDLICQFFGCVRPQKPSVLVEEVGSRHVRISWGLSKFTKKKNLDDCNLTLGLFPSSVIVGASSSSASPFSSPSSNSMKRGPLGGRATGKQTAFIEESKTLSKEKEIEMDDIKYASARKFAVEVDGELVGETAKNETTTDVKGLRPGNLYNIRVWAIAAKNMVAVSKIVSIKTLEKKGDYEEPKRMKSVFVQTTETEAQSGRATSPTTPLLPSASNIVASISSRLLGTQMMEPTNSTPRVEAATSPATAMSPESEESYIASETVKVTALMDQTRRLQRELDQNVAATKADHEARMAALNETLQNLRAERKATEPARTQLKMELKRLEELKRNSDAARSKAENGLNAAKAEQECTRSEIVRSAKEVETLKSDIVRMQQRAKIDEEAFEKKGKELEAQLGKIKSELKGVDAQRARAKKVEEDILNEIRVKEAVIAEIESETQSLLQKGQSKRMEELDEIEKAVEEDLKVWTEIQDKLLCEHLKNKAELKEEKRVKEVLLQELAKARSKHHSSSSSVAQSVLENRPSNKGPKIRLLQPSSELPSQPSYTETTCSLFSDFASTPTSSSQPTAPLQMCPPALQHPSSPFAGLQASSTPSNPSVVSQLPQSTMPLLEPIIPFETIQSSTLLQPPPPMHQPIPQQSVPVLPPGLTPSFDLMGALPRLPTSQPRGFNSATGLLSTPKEPPGLSGFAYTHAPSHAEARKSGNGSSHSLNSDKGDEIERAVANSLMGEINAFTI